MSRKGVLGRCYWITLWRFSDKKLQHCHVGMHASDDDALSQCHLFLTNVSPIPKVISMKCTVEERNSDEKIGWGKLESMLGNLTVKVALESDVDEEESLNVESLKISEESKDEVSVGSMDVEAKELCDDRGLAQISAQLFDHARNAKSKFDSSSPPFAT